MSWLHRGANMNFRITTFCYQVSSPFWPFLPISSLEQIASWKSARYVGYSKGHIPDWTKEKLEEFLLQNVVVHVFPRIRDNEIDSRPPLLYSEGFASERKTAANFIDNRRFHTQSDAIDTRYLSLTECSCCDLLLFLKTVCLRPGILLHFRWSQDLNLSPILFKGIKIWLECSWFEILFNTI